MVGGGGHDSIRTCVKGLQCYIRKVENTALKLSNVTKEKACDRALLMRTGHEDKR